MSFKIFSIQDSFLNRLSSLKVDNPYNMANLRPIALCNVIYKICSKAIANHLKIILPQIISPFQSAFVPGCLTTDNTLAANEVTHFIHNERSKEGYMALKLDISKAYDLMEWAFLRKVMERFGFAIPWIDMIMQCVTSVRYSFLVRGKLRGYVIPSRAYVKVIRFLPTFFYLVLRDFELSFLKKLILGLLPDIAICPLAPQINHLLFVDDSLIFSLASVQACREIQNVISLYGLTSGQLVNFSERSVVFSKSVSD